MQLESLHPTAPNTDTGRLSVWSGISTSRA